MTGRAGGDRGSATVWVLAACALLMVVGAVGLLRAEAVLARHRAESAADLAALAAAGRIGVGEDWCAAAAAVAVANGAAVRSCRTRLATDGRSGTVTVTVTATVHLPVAGTRSIIASARAGRLGAAPR